MSRPEQDSSARTTLPGFTLGRRRISVDVAHALLVLAIGGWIGWYWYDSYSASSDIENLSLILPTSAVALVFCVAILRECVHVRDAAEAPVTTGRKKLDRVFRVRLMGTMALLAGFVVASPYVGFDVGTFCYIMASLLFLGERRIWVLVLIPAVVCGLAIYCFNIVLATPLPLMFGGDQ